jgi:protocatechuate 3,4-dioxygenase beta subunit
MNPSKYNRANFVRGYQITDRNGAVTFKTIVPGWNRGRTIHIHVMVRTLCSSGSALTEFTTRPFFGADADQRADHFGFAVARAACRTPPALRTPSIPARRS